MLVVSIGNSNSLVLFSTVGYIPFVLPHFIYVIIECCCSYTSARFYFVLSLINFAFVSNSFVFSIAEKTPDFIDGQSECYKAQLFHICSTVGWGGVTVGNIPQCAEKNRIMLQNDQWRLLC